MGIGEGEREGGREEGWKGRAVSFSVYSVVQSVGFSRERKSSVYIAPHIPPPCLGLISIN